MYLKVTGELNDKGLAARVDGEERTTVGRERAHVDDGALAPRHDFSFATFFAAGFCFLQLFLHLDTMDGRTALVTLSIELMLQSTRAWNRASPFSTYSCVEPM